MSSGMFHLSYRSRLVALVLTVVLILGMVNYSILAKERILSEGTTVLLRLAPRDPRSLLQGDYMALRYKMADVVAKVAEQKRLTDGLILLDLAPNGEAGFVGIYEGREIAEGQQILEFRKRGRTVRLASDAFFFEEGQWQTFSGAAFGELKVGAEGEGVLTGLRDKDAKPLGALF